MEIVLLLLRLLSAVALLAFFGTIAYYLHKELRLTEAAMQTDERDYGSIALHQADQPTQRYPLLPVTTIGRSLTNTIIINNSYTSSQHALITRRGNQWWLEDLNSRNGTQLNDISVTEPVLITPSDLIAIGDVHLRLEL